MSLLSWLDKTADAGLRQRLVAQRSGTASGCSHDVVGSRVSKVFPSLACGEDVGETKCRLFCSEILCFNNKISICLSIISRIRSRSSNSIHVQFALIFRF